MVSPSTSVTGRSTIRSLASSQAKTRSPTRIEEMGTEPFGVATGVSPGKLQAALAPVAASSALPED